MENDLLAAAECLGLVVLILFLILAVLVLVMMLSVACEGITDYFAQRGDRRKPRG